MWGPSLVGQSSLPVWPRAVPGFGPSRTLCPSPASSSLPTDNCGLGKTWVQPKTSCYVLGTCPRDFGAKAPSSALRGFCAEAWLPSWSPLRPRFSPCRVPPRSLLSPTIPSCLLSLGTRLLLQAACPGLPWPRWSRCSPECFTSWEEDLHLPFCVPGSPPGQLRESPTLLGQAGALRVLLIWEQSWL